VSGRPFKTIKLKKKPAGPALTFPSEIRTVQAAIAFVKSLEPKTRAKLHWRLAQSALAAGLLGRVLTTVLTGQCATLWPPNAGWPTEWQQNNGMVCCVTRRPSGWRAVTSDWRHREPTGARPQPCSLFLRRAQFGLVLGHCLLALTQLLFLLEQSFGATMRLIQIHIGTPG
jgi:hypothetical protein